MCLCLFLKEDGIFIGNIKEKGNVWSFGFRIYLLWLFKFVVERDKIFKKWFNNVNFVILDFNGCLNYYKIIYGYNRKCVVKVFFFWFVFLFLIVNFNVNINIGFF